jgi:phosphohistidine swiveling domain-containing protein
MVTVGTTLDDDDIFSETADDSTIWTSGFFNERFSGPVSPLGWSLLRRAIERFALRDGLRFLGTPHYDRWPLTRLYAGRPYANMRIFQTLYKVFPDFLLPEDASRFFVDGDKNLRKQVSYPFGLADPRMLYALLRHFVRDPGNWSPLHNWRAWEDFRRRYRPAIAALGQKAGTAPWTELRGVQEEVEQWTDRLLQIHRFSLTDADIFFSILRRLLRIWLGNEQGSQMAAALTTGDSNVSLEMNRDLDGLSQLAPVSPDVDCADLLQVGGDEAFLDAFDAFQAKYGHRSLSLDIMQPTYADDPAQVLALVRLRQQTRPRPSGLQRGIQAKALAEMRQALGGSGIHRLVSARCVLVEWVAGMARRYLPLREDQRFYWQMGLAIIRRTYIRLGEEFARRGAITQARDIFFLTTEEVESVARTVQRPAGEPPVEAPAPGNETSLLRNLIARRRRIFDRLAGQWTDTPLDAYPPFIRGNEPLQRGGALSGVLGRAVSPGIGRGPAWVLKAGDGLAQVPPGAVLVAPSADPAWTPLFPHLAGLVLEAGGQLSHAAVVAREYGVPAVFGIAGATSTYRNGDIITVDGTRGVVFCDSKVPSPEC